MGRTRVDERGGGGGEVIQNLAHEGEEICRVRTCLVKVILVPCVYISLHMCQSILWIVDFWSVICMRPESVTAFHRFPNEHTAQRKPAPGALGASLRLCVCVSRCGWAGACW